MEADVLVRASHLHLITSPEQIEAAKNNNLYVENKKVLLIKNFPAAKAAEVIYREFAKREALQGGRFHVSFKLKSLVAKNQCGEYAKVGIEDFRKYVQHWFQLAEVRECDGKEVLILVNKLSPMAVSLYCQGWYITRTLIDLFPAVD